MSKLFARQFETLSSAVGGFWSLRTSLLPFERKLPGQSQLWGLSLATSQMKVAI